MRKQGKDFDIAVRKALQGKKVPILVLDSRWHALFPQGKKPSDILELEDKVNRLLKQQGHLVNELKDLKKTKKKLMDGIVAGMGNVSNHAGRKKDNQQRLLLEIKERIQKESDELMELPYQIKSANEELLVAGTKYCFERLSNGDAELKELTNEIASMREILKDKVGYKADMEESMNSAYSLMHGLLGHDVMDLFDKGKL